MEVQKTEGFCLELFAPVCAVLANWGPACKCNGVPRATAKGRYSNAGRSFFFNSRQEKPNVINELKISIASVKVMRSHDYCHFEVSLSSAESGEAGISPEQVDELRKQAARLADKAVEQYSIAKEWAQRHMYVKGDGTSERLKKLVDLILGTPEEERTPEEKAIVKAFADERYARRQYDYQDDWGDNQ